MTQDTMDVLQVSDVHVDAGRFGRTNPDTGRSTAWECTAACWQQSVTHAIDHRVAAMLLTGDLFLTGRPTAEAINLVGDGLRRLSAAGIPTVIVRGNHDVIGTPPGHRSVLSLYADLPGVHVAEEPTLIPLPSGLVIAALPWALRGEVAAKVGATGLAPEEADARVAGWQIDALDGLRDRLADEHPGAPAILAGHLTVSDATLGTDRRGTELLVHAVFSEPVIPVDELTTGPWAHTALGHIHRRQDIRPNVAYAGSLDRMDFSEAGHDKGATLISLTTTGTTTTAEHTLVPVDARSLAVIDLRTDPDAVDSLLETTPPVGTLVKVLLPIGETDVDPAVRARLNDNGLTVARVDRLPLAAAARSTNRAALSETTNVLDGLTAWANTQEIDPERLAALTRAAQQLLSEHDSTHAAAGTSELTQVAA